MRISAKWEQRTRELLAEALTELAALESERDELETRAERLRLEIQGYEAILERLAKAQPKED